MKTALSAVFLASSPTWSRLAAIATGTARAAECLGFGKETGAIEVGNATDLLVLDRDPLRDITVASDATARALVLRAEQPVGGTRRAAWFGEPAVL
jgi:imidazolonepropionase-like amidohydrolase